MLSHLGSDGQVDIVVATYDEDFLERRNCTALKLRDLQLSICMSSTHKLAQKEKISIEDLVWSHAPTRGGLLLRSDDWMRGYDNVKEISRMTKESKRIYDFWPWIFLIVVEIQIIFFLRQNRGYSHTP